jgi:hypothetical protein
MSVILLPASDAMGIVYVSTIHLEKIAKNFQMMTGLEDTITG